MSPIKARKKRIIGLLSGCIVIGGGLVAWRSGLINRNNQNQDISSYTVTAESGSLPGLITASGELKAIRTVNLSPDKQGLLQELYVQEGQKVEKGQLIAKMDGGDYQFRLNELKAIFEKEKAAFNRRKELFSQGAISAEQYEEYLNRFLTSKARLKQREVEGNELLIRAPFNGLITTRYAEPGSFVAPSTRASTIAGSTSSSIVELSQGLEVAAKVPESDIGRIRINQDANVRVDAFPDQRFNAKVSEIGPRALKTNNVTSFEVTLSLIKPPDKLRIGMTADVNFKTGKSSVNTLVPTVSIVTENGKPGVLIVGENNQPKFQSIELGASSGSKTSILKGIKAGDLIFIDLPPWANQKRE